jgi:hypothetical protein
MQRHSARLRLTRRRQLARCRSVVRVVAARDRFAECADAPTTPTTGGPGSRTRPAACERQQDGDRGADAPSRLG